MALDKLNTDLLNSLSGNIDDPFLVLDEKGNIVFFNRLASRSFNLKGNENIFDILDKNTSERINNLFQNVIQNKQPVKEQLVLGLNSGGELKGNLSLSNYNSNDTIFLFLSFKLQTFDISVGDVTNLQIKNDISSIIKNPRVLNIIDEIKSSFPFTFTSKNRIRKLINELDEFFWIKTTDGNYIIINENVASTIGLNFDQIEGKNENTFIPTYLVNFHLLIDQYVRESSNCVIVEGIRLNGFSNSERYQTIEIPLKDSENNVTAIICVGQKTDQEEQVILQQDFNAEDKKLISKGKLFEKIVHQNPTPIFIVEKENLKIIDVNESAIKLYGYKKEEFLNKDLTDLYSQEDIQTLLDSSVENLKEGIFYGPYKHTKKDGSNILVEMSQTKINVDGKEANLSIINDVTEKVQLEKNAQVYKSTFENTSDLLFITDSSGFITFINMEVTEELGYSLKELENTSFTALLHDNERASVNSKIFKSQPIETLDFDLNLKNSEGNFVKINLKAVPIFNYKKEIDCFSILVKIKNDLIQNSEIEKIKNIDETETTSQQINNINENPLPLSNIFHEILTPINVILGFVQELTENKDELSDDQREAIDIIDQNRVTLLSTMHSIVEYSNLESNKAELEIEEIKITDAVEKLHKEFGELKGTRKVDFAYGKISSSLEFQSDKNKFQNLISLLLMIGIRMSKEEKIYLSAYQINDENFAIVIKDNYGFTSDELLKNFSSIFDQDDFAARKNLGISKYTIKLVKKLLSLLKCERRILNESKKDKEFAFIFPINLSKDLTDNKKTDEKIKPELDEKPQEYNVETSENHSKAEENKTEFVQENLSAPEIIKTETETLVEELPAKENTEELNISELNCLYIEDQIDSQILFKVQMKELKKIKFALTFENAIPMLEKERFDFILMDINLPGDYNGVDALKIIHKSPGFENIPIIAVSAYLPLSEKKKFIAAGFRDFISKPLFRDKLVDALKKVF